ncbi:hypothetical protein [Legionella israelensis]|uniref:Uncharacterized protein n=1 Tax=Legionella israelensis TaxID=454 RepID=A0A0W0VPM5_9GAMM|nr:hypothetical protein [Legionella israelensis]KTD21999.1 hypothetical protein Lisr_1524 [Legionella israelensis]QBS08736.1 hypothetical protein E4T55_02005 [Legionella israelensis]SCY55163.1 hypothetical protein SAMN02746069_02835 [Legionella israelensis DSM 19235]STX58410.1 Uncharacterised protein [Legionella israelensis]
MTNNCDVQTFVDYKSEIKKLHDYYCCINQATRLNDSKTAMTLIKNSLSGLNASIKALESGIEEGGLLCQESGQ